ncbi:MAG: flagellar biosynthesis anti-sigma factor FlgM [Thermomonas hydrothermalis]|uniref:flagellar biosynthesis anti-sigma factor FlgM n=1 Tax=Thermomonas hydrothermalis TaxID=213588 RepID=UPI0023534256|nr:flagellar biosynthesis anti-sigma factor FlgM [Thermomonas hydrothermalis]MCL6618490.1 flagellar biosynthesis anti-sigma factor FlgM [Thermomonas hydrothermalis]
MTTKIDGNLPAKPVEAKHIAETAQPRAGASREAAVQSSPPVDSLRLTGEAVGLKALVKELAGSSRLDLAKVKEIRSSIDNGSYKIDPEEIADRLLALERELLK